MFEFSALLPLLGWFYLSLAGVVAGFAIFRQKFVRRLLLFPFFGMTIVGIVATNLHDWAAASKTWKEWNQSSRSKMDNYAGTYRAQYLETFYPALKKQEVQFVSVADVDPREFLYVRMYLYPILVRSIDSKKKDQEIDRFIIVSKSSLDALPRGEVLAESEGKVLLQLTGGK